MKVHLGLLLGALLFLTGCGQSPVIGPYQPEPDEPSLDASAGELLISFVGTESTAPPEGWTVEGEGTSLRLVRDAALDGRAFLQISAENDDFAVLRIVLPGVDSGRLALWLRARSPQAKWWQLAAKVGEKTLWQHNLPLSSSWQEWAWEFALPTAEEPQEVTLAFQFRGPGSVDLESLRLVLLDPEALMALAREKHGGTIPANLLRNSRLPLGLQTGWNLERHRDDSDAEGEPVLRGDETTRGPTEAPALRVEGTPVVRFYSEPFLPALPGEPHVASVFVKGPGKGTLRVLQDTVPLEVAVDLPAAEDWTRVELPFPTTTTARSYSLQFEVEGTMWLDGFQVEDGETARPLNGLDRPEVALSASRVSRVIFEDEPATVSWVVTGAPAGARLQGKVVNLYGEQALLPPVPLHASGTIRGETGLDVFSDRSLGVLRYEAWVTDAEGRRLSPYNEIVVHRLRRPRYENAFAPDSPFGIHTLPTNRHIEMSRAIGLTWVRLHDAGGLEWFFLEPEPGQWNFRDETIQRFREARFEILGLLGTSPLWANAWPGENKEVIHGFWDKWGAPGDLEAFTNYVRVITQRYENDIRVYEVWNEPWIPRFFSGRREPQPRGEPQYFHSETPQADYARLSQAAAQGAGDDRDIALVGLNSTAGEGISNRISGTDWSAGVVAADGIEAMDAISYHHYSTASLGYPTDDVMAGFQRAIAPVMNEGQPLRPVWLTEGSNTPAGMKGTFYNHTFRADQKTDLASHADRLLRYVLSLWAAGNEKIFLYSMHTHGLLGGSYRFTTLVTPDGFLHPDAAAFSNLAWWLEDRRFIGQESNEEVTVYTFAARDDAGDVVTVVAPRPGKEAGVDVSSKAVDLWGNPLGARRTGQVFFVPGKLELGQIR